MSTCSPQAWRRAAALTPGLDANEAAVALSHCGVLRSAITLSTFTEPPNVCVPPLNRKSLCEALLPPRAKQSILEAEGQSR